MANIYEEQIRQEYVAANGNLKTWLAQQNLGEIIEAWGNPETRKDFRGDIKAFLFWKMAQAQGQIK